MAAGMAIDVYRMGCMSCGRKSGENLNRAENEAVEVEERVAAGNRRGDNT